MIHEVHELQVLSLNTYKQTNKTYSHIHVAYGMVFEIFSQLHTERL